MVSSELGVPPINSFEGRLRSEAGDKDGEKGISLGVAGVSQKL
jgi:hypothetical protein